MSEWLDIESAPKDGTYFLASNPDAGGSWVARYMPIAVSGYRFDTPWRSCMLNHNHMDGPGKYSPPTVWQPLPSPPATPANAKEET